MSTQSQQKQLSTLITTPTPTPTLTSKDCPNCGHKQKISTDAKRTTCSKCDKPIKLRALTAILATVLMIAIVPAAYAEEVTIDVPFDVYEQTCTLYHDPNFEGMEIFRCWMANQIFEDDYQPALLIPTEEEQVAEPEPLLVCEEGYVLNTETNTCDAIPEPVAELTDDQIQIIAIHNTLDDLYKIENPTIHQQRQIDVLLEYNWCTLRGIDDAEAIQTRGYFALPANAIQFIDGRYVISMPQIGLGETYSYRDGSPYAKSSKLVQECKAQILYNGIVTPDHYRNMVMGEDDFQLSHQDAASLEKGIEAFGTDFTDTHDGDSITEEARSNYVICISDSYSEKFKKQMNCPSPYIGFNEPTREPTGFTLETASPNIEHERYGTVCGLIPNDEIVNDIHWDYLESLEKQYPCWNEHRITGIMLFDPVNLKPEMVDIAIAKYLESLE